MIHIEKPFRIAVLDQTWSAGLLSFAQLREGLRHAWTSLEFVHAVGPVALRLFRAAGYVDDSDVDLDEEDYAGPEPPPPPRLRGQLTMFRGVSHPRHTGLSWTLCAEKAEWFARRFPGGTPTVLTATVPAERVLGRFTRRGEDEVVCDPADVHILKRRRLD
jgi:hypothetical protein